MEIATIAPHLLWLPKESTRRVATRFPNQIHAPSIQLYSWSPEGIQMKWKHSPSYLVDMVDMPKLESGAVTAVVVVAPAAAGCVVVAIILWRVGDRNPGGQFRVKTPCLANTLTVIQCIQVCGCPPHCLCVCPPSCPSRRRRMMMRMWWLAGDADVYWSLKINKIECENESIRTIWCEESQKSLLLACMYIWSERKWWSGNKGASAVERSTMEP